MPSFGDRKKWDRTLVPATHAGRIAWVTIVFAACLSWELPWNALLFCHFSLAFLQLRGLAFEDVPEDLGWAAQQNQQPEPWAGSRASPRAWGAESSQERGAFTSDA